MKLKKLYPLLDSFMKVRILECFPGEEEFDVAYEGYLINTPYYLVEEYSLFPKELNNNDEPICAYYDEDEKEIIVRINVYEKKFYEERGKEC